MGRWHEGEAVATTGGPGGPDPVVAGVRALGAAVLRAAVGDAANGSVAALRWLRGETGDAEDRGALAFWCLCAGVPVAAVRGAARCVPELRHRWRRAMAREAGGPLSPWDLDVAALDDEPAVIDAAPVCDDSVAVREAGPARARLERRFERLRAFRAELAGRRAVPGAPGFRPESARIPSGVRPEVGV